MALFDINDCRLWLQQNGHPVGERGRIKESLQALYFAAGCPAPERAAVLPPAPRPSAPRRDDEAAPVDVRSAEPANGPESVTQRRGRKVLLPHHYDPRPSLFDADQLAAQKFWGIEPVRRIWTVEEVSELMEIFGEPPLVATMNLGEQTNAEV